MNRLRVSQLCVFLWRDARMICDDPLRHRQFALNTDAGSLLRHFADWAEADEVAARSQLDPRLINDLVTGKVLVEERPTEHDREQQLGPWAGWGTAATYYHLASRTHADDHFATADDDNRWLKDNLDNRPQPDPFKDYPPEARLALPTGDTPLASADLEQPLRSRCTTRRLDPEQPMTTAQLATLMRWTAGPLHRVRSQGLQTAALKASPSGGSRHAVEVYPVVLNVEGVEPGIAAQSLGLALAGPLALHLGLRQVLLAAGLLQLAATLAPLLLREIRDLRAQPLTAVAA